MPVDKETLAIEPAHLLFGASLKVSRAKDLISELQGMINNYMARRPYYLFTQYDPEAQTQVWKIKIVEPVPATFSAPIGDCIHNVRSVFDHIACAIVEQGGGSVTTATHFPIVYDESKFENHLHKFKGASQKAIDIVKSLQPFSGQRIGESLAHVHKLDLADKHRRIIPVAGGHIHFRINLFDALLGPGHSIPRELAMTNFFPQKEMVFLEDQAVVATASNVKIPLPDDNYEILFEIVLDKGQPLSGKPILAALSDVTECARETVALFLKEVFN